MSGEMRMKIQVITANNGWFVRALPDKDYPYPHLYDLYFNGSQPERTFSGEWYKVDKDIKTVQKKLSKRAVNPRYELNTPDVEGEKFPAVLSEVEYEEKTNPDSSEFQKGISALYDYKYDLTDEGFEDIPFELEFLMRCDFDIIEPSISYEGANVYNMYTQRLIPKSLTFEDVQHQGLDKIIFPDILLPQRPCSFSSEQMYNITRAYIKSHIDNNVAKIGSDYDFCFDVKKLVKKSQPEFYTYFDIFAKTKKQRETPRVEEIKYNSYAIFEMTYSPKNYEGYTPIPAMYANSADELDAKVKEWLEKIIAIINEPSCECPNCNGKGYLQQEKINLKGE